MARAALRPLAAFRPRGAEEPGEPGGPGKRWKPWSRTETPPRTGGKTERKTGGRTTDRKSGRKAGTKADAKAGRPLPFPLRLLAMLCAFAFMVAFAVALARVTLEPSPASVALVHSNLRPGDSLRAYLDQPELRDAVKQIGGNLLLGVPFGVLVPVVAPQARGLLRVLLLTAAVMLLVEFAQGALVTGRAFDIDDVILNTTGALIGYLILGRRVGRAVHARKPRA
ncbi:VanZ family protein [Streptomyces sp. NBC_00199]|uniref:VanZ family protein n=1 Tax=Streptomyces sp. NBC_00199 TaxID=2975678 RepID=UPI00225A1D56|nr:VanZ family protein [Streptomyces sp. NBC_00199]MCX5262837.1 VanZ family protein [Streptomyces sp. NBC_00199]